MLRAHIHENYMGRIGVTLAQHPEGNGLDDNRISIMRLQGEDGRAPWTSWETVEDPTAEIAPTLFLGHEEARVLLDALAQHYQGASDMRLLRADRDHERGRVDKLLDVVAEIAKGRA
jgi:hypothetical protein